MKPSPIPEFISDRFFRLWDIHVGHSHLLIRSPAQDNESENIDLIFAAVQYIELPHAFWGLHVSKPRNEHAAVLEKRSGTSTHDGEQMFAVSTGHKMFYVIASTLWIHTNTLHATQSSLIPMCAYGTPAIDAYYNDHVTASYYIS